LKRNLSAQVHSDLTSVSKIDWFDVQETICDVHAGNVV